MGIYDNDFIMFDHKGRLRRPDLTKRAHATAEPQSGTGYDYPRYQVVNAGWVGICQHRSRIIVFLRPAKAMPKAVAGALYHLSDSGLACDGPGNIVMLGGGTPLSYEFPTRHALLRAVCDVMKAAERCNHDRFVRRPAQRAELDQSSPVLGLAAIWHELSGQFDMERMWRCLTGKLNQRFVVVSARADGMHVRSLGSGFSELSHYWPTGQGQRLADQPDLDYGRWIEGAYREADAAQRPLVEAVDCDIEWPREGRRRHRYWRVLAPFRLDDGARIVLGATLVDTDIALRRTDSLGVAC